MEIAWPWDGRGDPLAVDPRLHSPPSLQAVVSHQQMRRFSARMIARVVANASPPIGEASSSCYTRQWRLPARLPQGRAFTAAMAFEDGFHQSRPRVSVIMVALLGGS